MAVVDAYGERKAEEALRDTWGHMDATPDVQYPGFILFAEGAFGGERVILQSEFGDAGYGPWFYHGIHEWLCAQDAEPGKLYRFEGVYRLHDGSHEFVGTITTTEL